MTFSNYNDLIFEIRFADNIIEIFMDYLYHFVRVNFFFHSTSFNTLLFLFYIKTEGESALFALDKNGRFAYP